MPGFRTQPRGSQGRSSHLQRALPTEPSPSPAYLRDKLWGPARGPIKLFHPVCLSICLHTLSLGDSQAMRRWPPSPGSLLAPFIPDALHPLCPKHTSHNFTQPPSASLPDLPSAGISCPCPGHHCVSALVLTGLQEGGQNCCFQPAQDIRPQGSKHLVRLSQTRKEMGSINSQLPPQIGVQVGRWEN